MNNITRIVDYLREHGTEEEPVTYVCAACKDTGWVEVDDGLEDGKRVRSPKEARCTSILHEKLKTPAVSSPERFS